MARARNIKPGMYKNEDLAECSIWARYLFPGLWMLADREGRLEDRPKRIKGELLPFDAQDVEPLLRELSARSFIVRYETEGLRCIQILKFKDHQAPHYSEKDSVIKPPPLRENAPHIEARNSRNVAAIKRGSQPPDSLIPDSGLSDSPNPDSPIPDSPNTPKTVAPGATPRTRRKANGEEPPTTDTWNAYAGAYRDRYGVDPVRNQSVNGQLANLVAKLGKVEAPRVAAFYVGVNRTFYVQKKHPVGLLLQDYATLRTEWVTGRAGTDTEARDADRRQSNFNAFAPLIAEAEERERKERERGIE